MGYACCTESLQSFFISHEKNCINCTFLLAFWNASAFAKDILGEYVTKPGVFPGLKDDGTIHGMMTIFHKKQ
jgi:hypothetical protein